MNLIYKLLIKIINRQYKMQYNFRQQYIKYWQSYVLNFSKYNLNQIFLTPLFLLQNSLSIWLIKALSFFAPLLLVLYSFNSQALSAITTQTIHGNAPYLTFDGGSTQVSSMDEILSIKLSDGVNYIKYTKNNNPSSESNPILTLVPDVKLKDIETYIPKGNMTSTLTDIVSDNDFWGDLDGDNFIMATGNLTLKARDIDGKEINANDQLDYCYAPYRITLTSDGGTLSTQYGMPRSTTFTGGSAIYYIKPKVVRPYTCFAQPNLEGNGIMDSRMRGPDYQWSDIHGFKPQDINTPSSNFPTTGANGLYFNLVIAGALGRDVTYNKFPSNSSINLNITEGSQSDIAKIELNGPSESNKNQTVNAVPTTFQIFANGQLIYSFRIQKWFMAKVGASGGNQAAQNYCRSNGYRITDITDLTNANAFSWTGGLQNQGNRYQRRIGGGVFAEWGITNRSYYSHSDFVSDGVLNYWTAQLRSAGIYYVVNERNGGIGYSSNPSDKVVCVRP